jgi:anti-sigma regulatory factor (Ser/Thr protein kinase)
MSATSFEVVLPRDVEAAGVARRAIVESEPTLPPSLRDDLSLLVTELVTNAVLHGGAADDRPVQVEFRRQGDRIRVEVIDPGTVFELAAAPMSGDASGGWGLFLVDQIAERWGVHPASSGTCVWFELPAGVTA